MKAIMLSIQPKWMAKILNCEKIIEVRKRFSSDYVGWLYVYVTKGKKDILYKYKGKYYTQHYLTFTDDVEVLNGKVVARFWCDKVEEIKYHNGQVRFYSKGNEHQCIWLKKTCLTFDELENYLGYGEDKIKTVGYAIHISDLVIFDKPKELSDFGLKRAPQSWQHIEVDE